MPLVHLGKSFRRLLLGALFTVEDLEKHGQASTRQDHNALLQPLPKPPQKPSPPRSFSPAAWRPSMQVATRLGSLSVSLQALAGFAPTIIVVTSSPVHLGAVSGALLWGRLSQVEML